MPTYLRYRTIQEVRERLELEEGFARHEYDDSLRRAIREVHDHEIGSDTRHVFETHASCLEDLVKQLGESDTEELLLPRVDAAYGLETLLNRLQEKEGLDGLAAYARHLLHIIQESEAGVGRYEGPVAAVAKWLSADQVSQSPTDLEAVRFREGLQRGGGPAATIGLSKCGDPGAAVHFVSLHLLRGLYVDQLLEASRHVRTYFWLLLDRPKFRHVGRQTEETTRSLKHWLAERLGATCPVTGADLLNQVSAYIVAADSSDYGQTDEIAAERWRTQTNSLCEAIANLNLQRDGLSGGKYFRELIAIDLPESSKERLDRLDPRAAGDWAVDILNRIYIKSGCFPVRLPGDSGTLWSHEDPVASLKDVEGQVLRISKVCGALSVSAA